MKKSLLQFAALISTLLLTSCAGSNTTTNTSAQNDESIQNTVAVQNVETAQNTEAVQAPIPDDDYFIQNARNFVAEQTELPNAESFIDAANKDDGDAAFILSMMYRMNIGGVEHIKKGKISKGNVSLADEVHRWTIIGLEREHLLADYAHDHSLEINHEQFSNGEYEKSRQWLELAAKNGLSDAEFVLGIVYYNGIGQPKDEAKGQELIARAAIHGLPIAQYYVGMFYELGMGTSVNKSKAMEWLVKAADAKNPDAEFILALKYLDGIDVDKNSEKAEAYRSSHENYHAWNLLMNKKHRGDFELICKSDYDLVSMGSEYDDECGGDADYYDPNLSERENERRRMEYAAQERANASLLYAIDYRIAWNWLDKVASDVTHINARLLRTQVCGLSGCKCGDELEYEARVKAVNDELEAIYHQNESSSVVQYALGSYYHHVIVRDNDDGEHEDITKQYAKKAFDLYISADKAGYERASVALGDMYYFIDEPRLGSFLDIDVNNKLAFEYYHRGNESDRAGSIAFQGGELAISKNDNEKGIKLLEIAANENNPNAYLLLGRIYKNGKHAAKDVDKAIGYFTKCLDERMKYAPIRECSLELGDIYNNLGKKNETLKYCKQAVETSHYYDQKGREYAMCSARIQSLQKMNGMQAALAHEIELEAGKNVKEFFVYKSAIKPCKALMKENPGYGRASKECNDIVQPLYEESIKKAIRGITALAIAENGKVDNELIENTYYYLAMFLANNEAFIGDLEKNSPNPGAIDELYDLNRTVRRRMFYIWYLRQIPYAAKDVFETKSNSKSWDSYLKEADKAIAKDDALKTGFGIDLLKYIDY